MHSQQQIAAVESFGNLLFESAGPTFAAAMIFFRGSRSCNEGKVVVVLQNTFFVETRTGKAVNEIDSQLADCKKRRYHFAHSSVSENQAVAPDLLVEALDAFAER